METPKVGDIIVDREGNKQQVVAVETHDSGAIAVVCHSIKVKEPPQYRAERNISSGREQLDG